jgi:hypothetical protein
LSAKVNAAKSLTKFFGAWLYFNAPNYTPIH